MEIAALLAFYILGILTGAVGMVTLTFYIGKRALDKRKAEGESPTKKVESVSSRMKKVKEITNEQLDLYSQVSGPQKNALHGRYKNGLNGRIKELEEEKSSILKSILTDGFDPEITVMDGAGVVTTVKLSEFMAESGITIEPKKTEPVSTKQVGKFTVHKGGKDDGGNTTH
jgi:hypothetical protein